MATISRGVVRLVLHDPTWADAFAEHAAAIRRRTGLPATHVQHVGSTSVEDLESKPILDVAIGADGRETVEQIAAALVDHGYIDRGDQEGSAGRLLALECAPNVRTVHVHVVRHGSLHWMDYVVFRDALRSDAVLREQYVKLKRTLAEQFRLDRAACTNGKAAFIRSVVASSGKPRRDC